MASISTSGIGSGLDINGLVTQLVTAEGQAQNTQLDAQEAKLQAKLSAFGSLRSAISTLQSSIAPLKDLAKFQGRAVSVADEHILTASADSTAATGSYQIEVQRLATAAKLQSTHFATADTAIGTGTLTIKVGTSNIVLTLDSTNNTLAKIRDAINAANPNPGVAASIVTGVDGAHLVLTGTKTGAANAITVTQTGGDGGLAALVYDPANSVTNLTQVQQALDARVIVDGIAVEGPSNSVSTGVGGLTLNLVAQSDPGVTTAVTVNFDQVGTTKAINDFAAAYNALVTGLQKLGSYDAAAKVAGPLLGDSTLRDFLNSARRAITSNVSSSTGLTNLSQVGISFALDGTMTVDASKLGNALGGQFDAVGRLFASTDGVAKRLDSLLSQYTTSNGLIDARTKGLQVSISDIGDRRTQLQTRLTALQTRLKAQFDAMDTLIAQLRTTSNFLTQQFGSTSSTSTGKTA